MFRFTNTATAPFLARVKQAHGRLPQAEHKAQLAGISHLHTMASDAVASTGNDPSPLAVTWHEGQAHIVIEHGLAGDKMFDEEFGHPEIEEGMPHPVIRTAMNDARPQARAIYMETLRSEMGV